ncbi:50S ribosomal protein L23 [Candidatus Peregrinibacteria bacterium]|nr:50S ribosomal protein L23 [Candidatus Peregrinibacteria bacterium]
MDITNVLKSPVVTEKSTKSQEKRKYTFLIDLKANKIEVKDAIEKMYGAKVDSVNIIPVASKVRLVGRGREITKRHNAKKAIVTLRPKQTLDFNKVKTSK